MYEVIPLLFKKEYKAYFNNSSEDLENIWAENH